MANVRVDATLPEELGREQKLEGLLEEGYKAEKKGSRSLTREFESADLEGWDDD
jgi:hypothetical protein